MKPFKIGNVTINPGLVLAPMSGVTCSAFRRLIKELNGDAVGLLVTEFLSVEAMTRRVQKTFFMMEFKEMERPLAIQIFGYDIERMSEAAKMVQDAGADILDINCGCPAPKVVRKGGGCELMRQPDYVAKLFRRIRSSVSIPLTMKMRSGWDEQSKNCLEIAKIVADEGVDGITVHGRTRAQLYRGLADWSVVQAVANAVNVPVCGSGDVTNRASADERAQHGVAGVYIGRAAIENPLVFREIVENKEKLIRNDPTLALSILRRYIELLREDFSDKTALGKVKQLASQMGRGQQWRKTVLQAMTMETVDEIFIRAAENGVMHTSEGLAGTTNA